MKENNPFYAQYKDESHWKDLSFSIYNYLEDEYNYFTSMSSIYKKKFTKDDFEMKVIPLSKQDVEDMNNKETILYICANQCFRYISEEQKVLPYQKDRCFKFGNAIVFVKLK